MKLYVPALLTLALISCGKEDASSARNDHQPAQAQPVTDQETLNKLAAEPVASNVLVRIPVGKDGTRDYSNAEAISMSGSVDMNNSAAVHEVFNAGKASQSVTLHSMATDDLSESSSEQFHGHHGGNNCGVSGCARPGLIQRLRGYAYRWHQNRANALYYGAGYGGYYRPYHYQSNCVQPLPQPVCYNNCGSSSYQQQQSYSYEYQSYQSQSSSSSNWYNDGMNGYGGYNGGYNGGVY